VVRIVEQAPPLTSISLLTANKQIRFIETLKRSCFSGQLVFASSKEERWIFYFYQGRIPVCDGWPSFREALAEKFKDLLPSDAQLMFSF